MNRPPAINKKRVSRNQIRSRAGEEHHRAHHVFRLTGRYEERLDLDHYLELLQIKPGALRSSLPLRQARDAGRWPGEYDRLWEALKQRHGESEGTRQLVDVLLLHRGADAQDVRLAAGLAYEYGCFNAGAVQALLRQLQKAENKMKMSWISLLS